MKNLRSLVLESGRPVREYTAIWQANVQEDYEHFIYRITGLEEFGSMVLNDLWSAVLRDREYVSESDWNEVSRTRNYSDDPSAPVPEEFWHAIIEHLRSTADHSILADRRRMERFRKDRIRFFHGRSDLLSFLVDFALNEQSSDTQALAIVGPPGQGKSALMAKVSEILSTEDCLLLSYFVGATEQSTNVASLLRSLVEGLAAPNSGGAVAATSASELQNELRERMFINSTGHRVVMVIDALNQLVDGHDLAWLPQRIDPSIRVILSTTAASERPEELSTRVVDSIERRSIQQIPLEPLSGEAVTETVRAYLQAYGKVLDAPSIAAIQDHPKAGNALFLAALLDWLRTLNGLRLHSEVPELIRSSRSRFGDATSVFEAILDQHRIYGSDELAAWLGYLVVGRTGMSSGELADLLAIKFGPEGRAVALRIERSLRSYLMPLGQQLTFFHGELRAAASQRCSQVKGSHQELAEYFDRQWKQGDPHALLEVAHHTLHADKDEWRSLFTLLSDEEYLRMKIERIGTEEIIRDFEEAFALINQTNRETARQLARLLSCSCNEKMSY